MIAGPIITTIKAGKINNKSGKINFTGVWAAFSSNFWRRLVRMVSDCTRKAVAILVPNRSA